MAGSKKKAKKAASTKRGATNPKAKAKPTGAVAKSKAAKATKAAKPANGGTKAAKPKSKSTARPKVATKTKAPAKAKAKARPVSKPAVVAPKPSPAKAPAAKTRAADPNFLAEVRADLPETPHAATLAPEDVALLRDLGDEFARAVDRPVSEVLEEAREVEAAVASRAERLVSGSRLDPEVLRSLRARTSRLVASQSTLVAARRASVPEALRPIVDEATTFERDAVAALRYFCDHDTSVQASLDALDVDATVVSLVESLRALATLLDTHGASLKHADLPERPGRHARELATALVELASPDDPKAVELRNRAFWHLRHALESVRSAARYLLRAEPASLTFFRAAPVRVAAI